MPEYGKFVENILELLDLENPEISSLYYSWDKGDCSLVGLSKILLIQMIKDRQSIPNYDGEYDTILQALEQK